MGGTATLTLVATVDESAAGSSIRNVVQVAAHDQTDLDSQPGNDDGNQSEDDEDSDVITIGIVRPGSKRDLLASSFR